jgi:membrane associated rhomboid family serine protease
MDSSENPFNSIPPVVILLVLAIMGIEAVLTMAGYGLIGGAAGIGWRITVAEDYAYSPAVWDLVFQRGDLSWDILMRFVTYTFVQGSFRQALYAGVLLLALGKYVGDAYGGRAVIVIYIASAITGAFVYGAIIPENVPLLGAYTPVYGMIGGYTYKMWYDFGQHGENQWRAFRLIAFLLTFQLAFGIIFGGGRSWTAEVAGFVGGLAVAPLVAPGGIQAMLARIRQR